MTFHLMFVHIIVVRFGLLSGHLLGKSCSLGLPCVLFEFDYLWFWLFPILVFSGAGFGF